MSSRQRNTEKRAEHEAAYIKESIEREKREDEYKNRWRDLYAALERAGIDPYELKTWIEDIGK